MTKDKFIEALISEAVSGGVSQRVASMLLDPKKTNAELTRITIDMISDFGTRAKVERMRQASQQQDAGIEGQYKLRQVEARHGTPFDHRRMLENAF